MMVGSRTILGWKLLLLAAAWCVFAFAGVASAQEDTVTLTVEPDHIGLGGVIRPGNWTPMLVTLENHLAEPLKVRLQWTLTDADGDEAHPERVVTLSPQRVQQAWLYGVPPANYKAGTKASPWQVKVIDESSGALLTSQRVVVPEDQILSPNVRAIAVTSALNLGLQPYEVPWTQQEGTRFLRGFDLANLPDRWYGLSMIEALIWTPDAPSGTGDPGSPAISPESRQALLEWVRRGGHLVIVLPATGDLWTGSPFKDLLGGMKMQTQTDVPPSLSVLGSPMRDTSPIDVKVLTPTPDMAVLLRDEDGRPMVVARQIGVGRITFVGVDVTDKRLSKMGMPNSYANNFPHLGAENLWATIFGWRGLVLNKDFIDAEVSQRNVIEPSERDMKELDLPLIGGRISMSATATRPLLMAIILFVCYWIAAGPGSFALLTRRGLARHAWVVFTLSIAVCAAVAWGGAIIMRPTIQNIYHFTVLDADATSGMVHVHSWISVYSPAHGNVEVAIDPTPAGVSDSDNRNTLAAPGLASRGTDSGFVDSQRYTVNAAAPNKMAVPFRATAKQLEADYLARWADTDGMMADPWVMPHGKIHIEKGWPVGQLTHALPGSLRDVMVIYNAGDGKEPWVWPWLSDWPAGAPGVLGPPKQGMRLVVTPLKPGLEWGGYLGDLIHLQPGQDIDANGNFAAVPRDQGIKDIEMLTFYNTLPTPRYLRNPQDLTGQAVGFQRSVGRRLDLSALVAMRRVIIIGHLSDQPLPIPMHVGGKVVPSKGWTTVRWISEVEN